MLISPTAINNVALSEPPSNTQRVDIHRHGQTAQIFSEANAGERRDEIGEDPC